MLRRLQFCFGDYNSVAETTIYDIKVDYYLCWYFSQVFMRSLPQDVLVYLIIQIGHELLKGYMLFLFVSWTQSVHNTVPAG